MLSLIICVVLLRKICNYSAQGTFFLQITSGSSTVCLPLFKIPTCPKFIHFQKSSKWTGVKVTGILKPRFTWNHGGLSVIHAINKTALGVPKQIPIGWLTKFKLQSILRAEFFMFIICVHNGHTYYIDMCDAHCGVCVRAKEGLDRRQSESTAESENEGSIA